MLALKVVHSKSCIKALKAKQGTETFHMIAERVFLPAWFTMPSRIIKKPRIMIMTVCKKAPRKFGSVKTFVKIFIMMGKSIIFFNRIVNKQQKN